MKSISEMGVAHTAELWQEKKQKNLLKALDNRPLPPQIFRPFYGPVTESMYIVNIFMLAEIKVNFTADKC
jgi:hypothetical protein